MAVRSPAEFARAFIFQSEDGGSTDPNKTHSLVTTDPGNWATDENKVRRLIGSNHGVTAPALAKHRGVKISAITREVMHALALEEAVQIAIQAYYAGVHLDRLPWNAVTASIMDFGWGAGYNKRDQYRAIVYTQHMIGVAEDGLIGVGGETVRAFTRFIANRTEVQAAQLWSAVRLAYYEEVIAANPAMAYARNGWRNRTNGYKPGTPWWAWFHGGAA